MTCISLLFANFSKTPKNTPMFLNSILADKRVFMSNGIKVISTFSLTKSVNKGMVTEILYEK